MSVKKIGGIFAILIAILFSFIILLTCLVWSYKEEIVKITVKGLSKEINTPVNVSRVELDLLTKFPEVAICFYDVHTLGSNHPDSKTPLLSVKKLYAAFDLVGLLQKKYVIKSLYLENGVCNLTISKNGTNNFDIFSSKGGRQDSKLSLKLKKIALRQVQFSYTDERNGFSTDLLFTNSTAALEIKSNRYYISHNSRLSINKLPGKELSFLYQIPIELSGEAGYWPISGIIEIKNTEVKLNNLVFGLNSIIDDARKHLSLAIKMQKSSANTLLELIPSKYKKWQYSTTSSSKLSLAIDLNWFYSRNKIPDIKMAFSGEEVNISSDFLTRDLLLANFQGIYSQKATGKRITSSIVFNKLVAIDGTDTLNATLRIAEPIQNPYLYLSAKGNIPLDLLKPDKINPHLISLKGKLNVDMDMNANLGQPYSLKTSHFTCAGRFVNLRLKTNISEAAIDSLNGIFQVDNDALHIKDLDLLLNNQRINLSASLYKPFQSNKTISSYHNPWNIFLSAPILDLRKIMPKSSSSGSSDRFNYPFFSPVPMELHARIGTLFVEKHILKNTSIHLYSDSSHFSLDSAFFKSGKAGVSAKAYLFKDPKKCIHHTGLYHFQHIQPDSLMLVFNGFGQQFIRPENIKGNLNADIDLHFTANPKGDILLSSIAAKLDIRIENGRLVNFEPMLKLSRYVQESALRDIRFNELQNRLLIINQKIAIPEMTVSSSITNFRISGIHEFNNDYQYRIRIPLKNFKKKENLNESVSIEKDNDGGLYLYLILENKNGVSSVSFDSKRVKNVISDKLKSEKEEFLELIKKNSSERMEKAKPLELTEDEYVEF